jgi:hypothetical protein
LISSLQAAKIFEELGDKIKAGQLLGTVDTYIYF